MDARLESRSSLDLLRRHWPEYAIEAFCLGAFMVSACTFAVLLGHPGSPAVRAIPAEDVRRALGGLAMGLTAVLLFYSPWGKRSGAHMNPAVTLAFFRLGKVDRRDALFYVAAQFVGGLVGVLVSAAVFRMAIAHPAVDYAVTAPGTAGAAVAFVAELAISFGMMTTVLVTSNSRKLASYTPVFAASLVALYITFEAPLSGMSMNPARSLGSALPAGELAHLWIYFTAPPAGMLLAAEAYVALKGASRVACAKLHHQNRFRCIFCEHQAARAAARAEASIEGGRRVAGQSR